MGTFSLARPNHCSQHVHNQLCWLGRWYLRTRAPDYHVFMPSCPDATKPRATQTSPFAGLLISLCRPACISTRYALNFQIQPQKVPAEEETGMRALVFPGQLLPTRLG